MALKDWVTLILSVATFVGMVAEKKTDSGWVYNAFLVLLGLFLGYQAFRSIRESIGPWFKRRRLRVKAIKYAERLPEFMARFNRQALGDSSGFHHMFQSPVSLKDGDQLNTYDLTRSASIIKDMADLLEARLAKPMHTIEDVRFAVSLLDELVTGILRTYRDQWLPFLSTYHDRMRPDHYLQYVKAREELVDFVRDYKNYRDLSAVTQKDLQNAIRSYHCEIPNPLP